MLLPNCFVFLLRVQLVFLPLLHSERNLIADPGAAREGDQLDAPVLGHPLSDV